MLRNHVAQRSIMRPSHVTVLLIVVTSYVAADLAEEIVDLSQCRDSNRLGKSLQHVEPPASCLRRPGGTGTTWCDTPGADYPWQAIRAYLRRSSDDVTRRTGQLDPTDIEKLLNKYGVSKSPSVVKRLRRSADVTSDARDVTRQQLVREAGRVTSRGSATTVTEATNFELDGEPKDGSTSDKHGGTKTKRINDKNLTEEDELVLLLTYFSNPNSIIFTESVLQGLMMMREASEGDEEQWIEKEGSESEMKVQGESVISETQQGDDKASGEHLTQARPGGIEGDVALEGTPEVQNATSNEQHGVDQTLESKEDSVSENLVNTETLEPYEIPSLTPTSTPVTTTQQDSSRQPDSSATSSSDSPTAPSPSAVLSAASPTVSPPPSTIPATSLFPDVHSRRPSPLRHPIHAESPPYGDLPMASSSSDISSPGIRTGAQVLQQIQTGEDILAEFSDRETSRPSTSGGASQDKWSWSHQGSHVNSQTPEQATWDDDTWTDDAHTSWGTKTDGHDSWGDEHFPPEVQYYRPTRPPPVEADPVDAFQWVDSPTPEWRPMRPSPQAESLVVLPPEKGDQKKDRPERVPVRGGGNSGGDGGMYEAERIVVGSKRRPTTRRPETVASLAEELEFIEETVYTEPIYRPNGEAEVSPTAAMTPTTTEAPMTSSGTTADPYVMSACDVSVEVRSPYYAMNTQNVWKMLINIPPFETYIHMEHCVKEHKQGR
ncbi:hypothetical protein FJT64_005274 [Amphibalanus amphitrite]|uniref:Uncharacterized protein n=1 Tax=Amphibalanus amphitrite TaxID=1232801 RepID=A0A6A4W2G5_AMPAM|nr:hypothetical protein FJT64_005274 [Amphibalanus amphitrite]